MNGCRHVSGLMLISAVLCGSAANALTIENDAMAIVLEGPGRGFAITSIVNKVSGRTRFLEGAKSGPDFWMLKFRNCSMNGRTVNLQNHTPSRRSMRRNPDGGATFAWENLCLPGATNSVDVYATVAFAADGASIWTLDVTNRATNGWALDSTFYPYFRNIAKSGTCDALVPTKELGARLLRNVDPAKLNPKSYGYPGWYPMVTAFMRDGAGIYMAAHDREARIKNLGYTATGDVFFETPVENAGVPGKAAGGPLYPVAVTAFKGDWWTAAAIYRKFAMTCPWTAKGPIARRADYPKAMSDVDIWFRVGGATVPSVSNIAAWIREKCPGVKVGLHWYNWNIQPFDTDYPEFRAQKGVDAVLASCPPRGILAMPYVNGRLWDTQLMSFDYGTRDACAQPDGTPQIETYGHQFAVMCPAAKGWQDVLFRMGTNVVEGLGAPAIYYDQISCSRPRPCHNPAHGHPLGGGSYWADGYRAALQRIHDRFSAKNIPITSEGGGETWYDVVDGHLICGRAADADDVPFLPAVYSGYTIFFGTENSIDDTTDAFFARVAQATLMGVVTGRWGGRRIIDPFTTRHDSNLEGDKKRVAYILACAQVRRAAADFLVYGLVEDRLRPIEEAPPVTFEWNLTRTYKLKNAGKPIPPPSRVTMPAVIGVVRRDVDARRRAVVAANVSDARQTVRFKALSCADAPKALELPGQPAAEVTSKDGVVTLTLAPHSFACVYFVAESH